MSYLFVFVALAISGLLIGLVRISQKRHKCELQAQIRKEVYYHSLDFHTLFNFLNTLASLIMTDKPLSAYDLLIAFNKIFKQRISFEPPLTWSFRRELDFIKSYQEAAKLIGSEIPDLVLNNESHIQDFEIPVLSVYSVYRIITNGMEILPDEGVSLTIHLKKGKYHLTFTYAASTGVKEVHHRSEELLMLYNKYYGRDFQFLLRSESGEASIQWKS
ncbi:MAG: histidine kinase [Bacteroidales bacterium]